MVAAQAVAPAAHVPTLVERGEYIATICSCAGCHTPWGPMGRDNSKLYAGSPGRRKGEGGTSNITPDPVTGIGKWTDAQIIAAIREGKDDDGRKLSSHMPSAAYHAMTDDDARALVAYLRSIPAIVNKIEEVKMDAKEMKETPDLPPATGNVDVTADPVKHGAYIVGIMRCVGCHTPRKGDLAGKAWAGGNEFDLPPFMGGGKFFSSNLTSDSATGIGMWKAEDVAASVRELVRPDGTKIHGPMNGHKDDYARLSDADAMALAAFIKAIPPIVNKVPAAVMGGAPAAGKS
jgi:mono/diheme cytochrome c family protein